MAGPSSTLPANPPTGTTSGTGLCCACEAFDSFFTNGYGNYFTTTYPHSTVLWNGGLMEITRTETAGRVKITKTIEYKYINGADPNDSRGANLVSLALLNLNTAARNYRIELNQPGCKTQKLAIVFELKPVASGGNASISFDGTPDVPPGKNRSEVDSGIDMLFYLDSTSDLNWVMLHEMFHLFGQPDEYSELLGTGSPPTSGGTVTYTPPAVGPMEVTFVGTATQGSKSLPLTYAGPMINDPGVFLWESASLMGQNGNWLVPGENFFWVAIEVEKVFAAEGTPVTAKVVLP